MKRSKISQRNKKILDLANPKENKPEINERKRSAIIEIMEEAMFADGFDDEIIGVCYRFGMYDGAVAYDYDRVIAKLVKDGMNYEEAVEYFDYNIIGAWVGDKTPVFIKKV